MAESLGQAILTLTVDPRQYDKAMDSAHSRVLKLGQSFQKVGKTLTLGLTLPLAAAGVAAGKASSDLAESMNAVNVVFGDSAAKIAEWGKTAANSVGLAQSDFNQAATTIGSMLQNVGMSASEAADQSINLTQRAADMASVFNTDVSDALGAIQAGIRGEIDPLERFGVGLSMAAVQAYAVEKGIAAAGAEMTNQQKITARLGLLMEQTSKVAGDFANTADQSANSYRVLKSRVENVAARIGEKLLPIFDKAVETVSRVVDWIDSLSDSQQKLLLIFAGTAAAVGPAMSVIGTAVITFTRLSDALGLANTALLGPLGLIALVVGLGVALGATATAADRAKRSTTGIGSYEELRNLQQGTRALEARSQALEDAYRPMDALAQRSEAMEERWKGIQQAAEETSEAAADTTAEMERQRQLAEERFNETFEGMEDYLESQKTELEQLRELRDEWENLKFLKEQTYQLGVQEEALNYLNQEIAALMRQNAVVDDYTASLDTLREKSTTTWQETEENVSKAQEAAEAFMEIVKELIPLIAVELAEGVRSTFASIGEAAEKGEDVMNAFGKSVTLVFANLLDAIGEYLLKMALAYALALQWGKAALATAGAAAAFAAAGFVRSWAEHAFAEGGLIEEPVVGVGLASGESYSFGERGPERVNQFGSGGGGGERRPLRIYLDRRLWYDGVYDASVNGDIVIHPHGVRVRR